METFYTRKISDEVMKALHEVNFPFPIADMGFVVPQIVEMPVDYASVLDWLIDQGFHISIGNVRYTDKYFSFVEKDDKLKTTDHNNLIETFDKAILLAIEFLKNDNL